MRHRRLTTCIILILSAVAPFLVLLSRDLWRGDLVLPTDDKWLLVLFNPCIWWMVSPFLFALVVAVLAKAPDLLQTLFLGSLSVCSVGWLALLYVALETAKGNAESGTLLFVLPVVQWMGFLLVATFLLVARTQRPKPTAVKPCPQSSKPS